ncbi:MAG: TnsA endonuclease N-terminal domain-containing protein [Gemmatimonadaceae bacterium]|nr:TnsA endonuclease N-terminal domain-containing protein [Gemmatimonadaceae bacterium]
MHHSLSRVEFHALLQADFRTDVLDIREQYPAASQSEVETIAQALGVDVPRYKDGLGLTTDLLLTVRSGRRVTYEAVYCKYSSSLLDRRANELLAIEREVWSRRGVLLREFTETSLTAGEISNLLWLHPFRRIDSVASRNPAQRSEMVDALWDLLSRNADRRISQVCAHVDTTWSLAPGSALAVVRWAIAQHQWTANLRVAYSPGTRIGEFLCQIS